MGCLIDVIGILAIVVIAGSILKLAFSGKSEEKKDGK